MPYSETHRQFYLNAAGIRMWYARQPLPGAAPSPEYHSGEDALEQEPVCSGDTGIGMPAQSRLKAGIRSVDHRTADLQSLMAAKPAVLPPVEEGQTESVGEPGSHYPVAAHLGMWSTESYLLISQWSEEASERLQDSLARNLLTALRQVNVRNRQMLNWPVFRNPDIPGNSPDDFRQILSRLVSSYQNRSIILLGVLSVAREEQRQYCLKPVLSRVALDFPCSLAELSATPDHKRDLWAALKSRLLVGHVHFLPRG